MMWASAWCQTFSNNNSKLLSVWEERTENCLFSCLSWHLAAVLNYEACERTDEFCVYTKRASENDVYSCKHRKQYVYFFVWQVRVRYTKKLNFCCLSEQRAWCQINLSGNLRWHRTNHRMLLLVNKLYLCPSMLWSTSLQVFLHWKQLPCQTVQHQEDVWLVSKRSDQLNKCLWHFSFPMRCI